MKPFRRLFAPVLLLCLWASPSWTHAATDRFSEGSQYQRIDPPLPLAPEPGRVEVVELFFYACPHCRELDPKIRAWLEDKPDVDFRRMPAIIGPTWVDQARAFYMAVALGQLDRLHPALFKAIHEDGKQLYNEYAVIDFFVENGIDRQKATELYRSPEVAARVNEARIRTVKYGLRGVPAVVVNGTYKTAPYFVRDQAEMLDVLDSLIEKERALMQAKTADGQRKE